MQTNGSMCILLNYLFGCEASRIINEYDERLTDRHASWILLLTLISSYPAIPLVISSLENPLASFMLVESKIRKHYGRVGSNQRTARRQSGANPGITEADRSVRPGINCLSYSLRHRTQIY